jgi:CheY-like chemotaxis protein
VDWKLPGIDGVELSKKLKEKTEDSEKIVVIMISAAQWNEVETEAKEAGVDRFLSKPIFPSTIMDIINESLATHFKQPEDAQPDITGIFEGHSILLVEDVEINREIVMTLLESTGLKIECAENGLEAVRMFSENPEKYDLIFMDVQMPEMDGYEATRRIRKLNAPKAQAIPIIAITANVFREDIEKCLESGMDGHVGKPFDIDDILRQLKTYF